MDQLEVRVPGPTPLPPQVRQALSRPMVSHRSQAFRDLLHGLDLRIRPMLGTQQEVLFLTASGTGGLEAAICNTIEAGDRVLSLSTGYFGERFAGIAARYGAKVDYLRARPGATVDAGAVAARLSTASFRAVLVTHSETSTGVLNPVGEIARVVNEASNRPLLLLDGVSSLGAVPLAMDTLNVDVVVTASQKAWMTPPGLAMVALSDRAWERASGCTSPRYYFDLAAARDSALRGETPWTPGVSLLYGLEAALGLMEAEGFERVTARHLRLAARVREGLVQLGFSLVAAPGFESPTVTAAYLPAGVEAHQLTACLERDFGIQIAGGQADLKGRIIRIGHMGYIGEDNVTNLLRSIESALALIREEVR
ncbi:MAG: alanine--glyoxylate aminotransferase family protein [Anaerolineae bacterium]|nr:alanine--glyoxylate aminotransferase family protein [Anaerolineae bacterium]